MVVATDITSMTTDIQLTMTKDDKKVIAQLLNLLEPPAF